MSAHGMMRFQHMRWYMALLSDLWMCISLRRLFTRVRHSWLTGTSSLLLMCIPRFAQACMRASSAAQKHSCEHLVQLCRSSRGELSPRRERQQNHKLLYVDVAFDREYHTRCIEVGGWEESNKQASEVSRRKMVSFRQKPVWPCLGLHTPPFNSFLCILFSDPSTCSRRPSTDASDRMTALRTPSSLTITSWRIQRLLRSAR